MSQAAWRGRRAYRCWLRRYIFLPLFVFFFGTHGSQNSQKSNLADYRVPTSTAIVLQSYETSNIVEFNADNEV
jgi:hypothetical protein